MTTQIADLIIPELYTPYFQQQLEFRAKLFKNGVLTNNPYMSQLLAGPGLTFNVPSFQDLDDISERVSNDSSYPFNTADANVNAAGSGTSPERPPNPNKIKTSQEVAVRLSRNNSWSSMDLAGTLAGADPTRAIVERTADYWAQRLEHAFIATWKGVSASNDANNSGDYTYDISGTSFDANVTSITARAIIRAQGTLGDNLDQVKTMLVHSVVYTTLQNNNLIDFIPDSEGKVDIPLYQGKRIVVSDQMPQPSPGVYETWLFGEGATHIGIGRPSVPIEVERKPGGGNGSGQEVLYSRVEWAIHPVGHAFVATPPNGGPANTGTAFANLDDASSWQRVYPSRKQIKFARLITREA